MKAYFNGKPIDIAVFGTEIRSESEPIMLIEGVDWIVSPEIDVGFAGGQWILSDEEKFMIFAQSGDFAYSYDGVIWVKSTVPKVSTSIPWVRYYYVNGKYFAFHNNTNSSYIKKYLFSEDGITWTIKEIQIKPTYGILNIAYGDGKYVLSFSSNYVIVSEDLETWYQPESEEFIPCDVNYIRYFKGKFYGCDGSKKIIRSSDLINWKVITISPIVNNGHPCGMMDSTDDVLMCCGPDSNFTSGSVVYTLDGIEWKQIDLTALSDSNFYVLGIKHIKDKWFIYGPSSNDSYNCILYAEDYDLNTWHKAFYPSKYQGDDHMIAYKDGLYIMTNAYKTPFVSFQTAFPKERTFYKKINALPDDPAHGSVIGNGIASKGMYVRLEAKAMIGDNWGFTHWSENGEEVSRANPYYFTVEKDRNLIANFNNLYLFGRNWFATNMTLSSGAVVGDANVVATQVEFNQHNGYFYILRAYNSSRICITKDFKDITALPTTAGMIANAFFTIDDNGDCYWIYNGKIYKSPVDNPLTVEALTDEALPETKTYTWNSVAHANGMWVVTANNMPATIYSRDAIEWTFGKIDSNTGSVSRHLRVLGGKFVMLKPSTIYISDDGIKWYGYNTSELNVSSSMQKAFWDGSGLVIVAETYVCKLPDYDISRVESYRVATSGSSRLRGGMYANGMYIFYTTIATNYNPKFWYGESLDSLQQSDPIADVLWPGSSNLSQIIGAYGNGMAVVIGTGHGQIIYSHPGRPID